jgi:hypothetical protein
MIKMKTKHHLGSCFETKQEHLTWFPASSLLLVIHTAKIEMHQHQAITARGQFQQVQKNNLCITPT